MGFFTYQRHPGPELMDSPNIPAADLVRNLRELETVNTYLGGYKTTLKGLSTFITDREKTYSIIDFGTGGGDTLKAIYRWSKKNGYKVQLTGLDISSTAIEYAKTQCAETKGIRFVHTSYQDFSQEENYDIAICSLFCHHLYGEDLEKLIQKMANISRMGIVINDLHRHWLAWASIKILTQLFSKSYLVKNDAPLSVLRGFKKREWVELLLDTGFSKYTVQWGWAFRHLIIATK